MERYNFSMKNKKKLKTLRTKKINFSFLVLFISLALALSIILSGVLSTIYNPGLYRKEFQKLGIYEQFPDADNLTNQVLYYTNFENIDPRFDEKELRHIKEVNILFLGLKISSIFFLALSFAGILFIFFKKKKELFPKIFTFAGAFSGGFVLIILLIYLMNFEVFFNLLHAPFFTPGSWTFSGGLLVSLFPQQFFMNLIRHTLIKIILISAIFVLVGFVLKKKLTT